ncbi:hypothetical protein F4778DRAFT_777543 [Xylariomycetidae sp. FL2044]|nr:hypothetical protein F4778DRAFT_777543 [Xylariomycetidae sp. FL2044]
MTSYQVLSTLTSLPTAIALCLIRLGLRRWRQRPFTNGDCWCFVAMIFIGLRLATGYYTGFYGTPLGAVTDGLTPWTVPDPVPDTAKGHMGYYLTMTGKMEPFVRVATICILWNLKMAVLDLLKQFLRKLPRERIIYNGTLAAIGITFAASFITVFLECRPFHLYWYLFPDIKMCHYNMLWVITYEVGNTVTDTILLVIPFPIIFRAHVPFWKRVRLMCIFGLGLFLIAVNLSRLIKGLISAKTQMDRIIWGSIEVGVASLVACLPTVYILLRPFFKRRKCPRREAAARDADGHRPIEEPVFPRWDHPVSIISSAVSASAPHRSGNRSKSSSGSGMARAEAGPRKPRGSLRSWLELEADDTENEKLPDGREPVPVEMTAPGILVATEIDQEVWNLQSREHSGGEGHWAAAVPSVAKLQGRQSGEMQCYLETVGALAEKYFPTNESEYVSAQEAIP